jgi:rod shape-determining protein MreC
LRIDPNDAARTGQEGLRTSRLMAYILVSVVLMAMDQRGQYIPRARAAFEYLVEPVFHLIQVPVDATRVARTWTRSYGSLVEDNEQQATRLLTQAGELQRLAALREENARLRALLDATAGQDWDFRFAEMVQVNLDPYSHQVVIDRGADDGVFVGQAVIDGAGVVGQVETVLLHQSRVRLISDPDHAIPLQILRTGQRSVAFGTGDPGLLVLPSLPAHSDLREGDVLVTSGLGDRFPAGFPVAEVSHIERDTGGAFARVEARPLAALDRGREVLLVVPNAPHDQVLPP